MISQQEAGYVPAATGVKRCAFCSMFRLPASCTLVKGTILPMGVCDKWASFLLRGPE